MRRCHGLPERGQEEKGEIHRRCAVTPVRPAASENGGSDESNVGVACGALLTATSLAGVQL
jgi:hypothetical protein